MSSEWPPPRSVTTDPVLPRYSIVGWLWASWPSAGWTMMSCGSIAPSSGSVTSTSQLTSSPQSTNPPLTGPLNVTVGLVLPTVTGIVVVPSLPSGSVTVRRAV